MARARNIKPGFFRNADLVELPFEARLLFIGLWTIADRAGRLEDRPKQIKMELFPADNMDCNALLSMLSGLHMIDRYTVENVAYIQITNFSKHQNPHKDEKASVIPGKDGADLDVDHIKHHASTVQAPCKDDASSEVVRLIPDSLIPDSLIPDSLIPETPSPKKPKKHTAEFSAEFEMSWAEYPERIGASKKDSFKAWSARLKAGVSPYVMIDGVKRYAAYCKSQQIEQQFIKQPSTFFGSGEHYLSDWTVRATQSDNDQIRERARARLFGGVENEAI